MAKKVTAGKTKEEKIKELMAEITQKNEEHQKLVTALHKKLRELRASKDTDIEDSTEKK